MTKTLTFGSLFAGVGGFDLGFEAAGWQPCWQVEWDSRCQDVLTRRWPEVAKFKDVRDVGVIPLAGRSHDEPGAAGCVRDVDDAESSSYLLRPVDCITFGFPCQDLSVAGQRAGLDGSRSNLFFEAIRIINEMRQATDGQFPTFAVVENVTGLLNADKGVAMGRCLDALAEIGAVGIEWTVLDAQHFGVPQRRRRVFIVAWFNPGVASGQQIFPVGQSCERDSDTGGTSWSSTAGTIASSVAASGSEPEFDDVTGQLSFVKVRRAQNVDDFETWESGRPAPTLNAFDNGSESRATVLTLANNDALLNRQVSHAVTTKWSKGSGGPSGDETQNLVFGGGLRRLTPRECERLMGWPDDHTRWGSSGKEIADSSRYRMCGNGVVAPVAEWVARRLEEALGK